MRTIHFGVLIAFGLGALAFAVAPEQDALRPTLEMITRLEGDWYQLDEEGAMTDVVASSYRVTAGGSAVIETIFGGTEHEMVTVYYMDGDDLMLTHYCLLANQPQMRARMEAPGKITWEFTGGTNIRPDTDHHMHDAVVEFVSADHLKATWSSWENGTPGHAAEFNLKRKPKAHGGHGHDIDHHDHDHGHTHDHDHD